MDGADFFKKFLEDIAGAEKSVTIISPFISKKAVLEIIDKLPKHIQLLFVTLPPGLDYLTGAVEPEAIEILSKNGFTIKVFPNIHAKLYIVDEKICYIGSANCTARGMGLIEDCNKEFMTKVDMQDEDFSLIYNECINKSSLLLISDGWLNRYIPDYQELQSRYKHLIHELQEKINQFQSNNRYSNNLRNDNPTEIEADSDRDHQVDQYEKFLAGLKEANIISSYVHQKNGYGKQTYMVDDKHMIKVFFSKGQEPTKLFEKNYRFAISKAGVEDIKSNKIHSIVFVLGEEQQFVSLPRTFLESTFFPKNT